ncbi:hypothetical protein AABB24_016402 [Solanum stoloniferum]
MVEEILQLYRNSELRAIVELLMDPTWVATGLKVDFDTLVNECGKISCRISEIISVHGESDQKISSYPIIPNDFFEDMELLWKGRVKRIHLEDAYAEVEKAADALSLAITEDFLPIISRIRATMAPLGGTKGEILYAREHGAVWFKGKRFVPTVWAGTAGEEQIKHLRPALDSKGKKVGEEWFTTMRVEDAIARYHEASAKAKSRVLELLRGLSSELLSKINILIFASVLNVIAKSLFSHVSEGRRRNWIFPTITQFNKCQDTEALEGTEGMKIIGLSPYWFDAARGTGVQNTVDMQSMFLLTGPNGGGKSSLLRSLCAAALLGMCGFMVPAESAVIPHFDSIMLHMKSYDSPADGKSSFQIEMSEIRSLITGATSSSLVLIDEICRGTETAKGTCIAGSVIETLDAIGCLGIVSTHLHGIFDLPLKIKKTVYKAMGAEYVDGQPIPTWKLIDGVCKESLAFETAQREGIPEILIQRAEEFYNSAYGNQIPRKKDQIRPLCSDIDLNSTDKSSDQLNGTRQIALESSTKLMHRIGISSKKLEDAICLICEKKLIELYKMKNPSEMAMVNCVLIAAREQPAPSTIGASSVYIMLRPDKKLYVGQTDDLEGRVRAHRLKEGMENASFLYFLVSGKSIACQLETLLINQLPNYGFQLTNVADGKHRNFGTTNLSPEPSTALR